MSAFMEGLGRDHRRLARILFALQAEIDRFGAEDDDPDYQRLLAVLDYLADYPEQWHHPAEERAFDRLETGDLDPQARAALERVREQHARLPKATERLRRDVEAVMQGTVVPRERLAEDARAYVEMQAEHLQLENEIVFPALERALGPEGLAALDAELEAPPDPRFERLYYGILEAEHSARPST